MVRPHLGSPQTPRFGRFEVERRLRAFEINGVVQAERSIIDITHPSWPRPRSSPAIWGQTGDTLQIRAFDGFAWSAPDNGAWAPFHISVS